MKNLIFSLLAIALMSPYQPAFSGTTLTLPIKNAETGKMIFDGSFEVKAGRKTLEKGKLAEGYLNVSLEDVSGADILLSAPGFFDRVMEGVYVKRSGSPVHLIPQSGVWLSMDLIHDLNFSGKKMESVRISVTDLSSGKSIIQEAQEEHWVALELNTNTSYRIELAEDEMETMEPIFLNTSGINTAIVINRVAELSMKKMVNPTKEMEPTSEDLFTEGDVEKPNSTLNPTPTREETKEVEVPKQKREIPEGVVAVDVEAIEAEMRANKEIPEVEEEREEVEVPKHKREIPEGVVAVDVEAIEAEMRANKEIPEIEEETEAAPVKPSKSTGMPVAKDGPYVSDNQIYFPAGKATLDQSCMLLLDDFVKDVKSSGKRLRIEVYSDTDKEKTIEDYICELRADIVTSYLLKEGVSFAKLEVSLIGSNMLANDCMDGVYCTEGQHQANRRVKLILK